MTKVFASEVDRNKCVVNICGKLYRFWPAFKNRAAAVAIDAEIKTAVDQRLFGKSAQLLCEQIRLWVPEITMSDLRCSMISAKFITASLMERSRDSRIPDLTSELEPEVYELIIGARKYKYRADMSLIGACEELDKRDGKDEKDISEEELFGRKEAQIRLWIPSLRAKDIENYSGDQLVDVIHELLVKSIGMEDRLKKALRAAAMARPAWLSKVPVPGKKFDTSKTGNLRSTGSSRRGRRKSKGIQKKR